MDVTALKRTRKLGWMISPVETRQIGFLFFFFFLAFVERRFARVYPLSPILSGQEYRR